MTVVDFFGFLYTNSGESRRATRNNKVWEDVRMSGSDHAVIAVQNLRRAYKGRVALDDVSLSVPKGCVFGLLGESGAGKTTLIRHLMGLLRPQQGSVRVLGRDPITDPEGALGHIGYLSEDRDLPGWMRIDELMRYTRGLYPKWEPAYAEELRERFDLNPAQKVGTLSKGQKAKAGLICALAHRPELLILDEPSSGLDPVVRRHILSAVMRSVADEGRTILFSSHLLDEVERVADYVAIIHRGKLLMCDRLTGILEAHCQIHIQFAKPQAHAPKFEGALHCDGSGTEWRVLCDGEAARVRAQVSQAGARVVTETRATLEDIFVARVGY
jgi:ABC-2 type transport system ATP-binding protein